VTREIGNGIALALGVIALAVGGPWLVREIRSLPGAPALAARSGQKIVSLEVGGMTCSGCAAKVKSELVTVAGVGAVEVRHQQHRAYVVCDPAVPDTALIGAVSRAGPGFTAVLAER
jgi:copper chaperone CopZ